MDLGFISVIAPVVTIGLALITKNVFLSLLIGVFLGKFILSGYSLINGVDKALYSLVDQFKSSSNTIVIFSIIMLGGLIKLIEDNGGVSGFVNYLTKKSGIIKTKRGANFFTWLVGVLVFTSGTVSCLVTGAVSRPLNDAMGVAPEKSAYIVHTTSTPVCVLLPLSGWGAFMIGLLQSSGVENAPEVLVRSIYLNFYCMIAVVGTFLLILLQKDFGPMKEAVTNFKGVEAITNENVKIEGKMSVLLVPLFIMIGTILTVLFTTGKGDMIRGDGYKAILWGIFLAIFAVVTILKIYKIRDIKDSLDIFFKGAGGTLPMATVLLFAFAMGGTVKELGTGLYLAEIFSKLLNPALLPTIIFIIACLISFTTGTSMGTMAVTMSLAIPMALKMNVDIALTASAVFGGSIFGDHSSPISDTSILSCSTTGCNIIKHVKTQMPYTLTFAVVTIALYLVLGFVM
ncbi:Na+/H+ antiporter NhaC family protein [Fusobacterium sp.]|uniref:Na+/H+ antiporter NhaC family protein n=1 Tax=Fusobacterium sp. TaxID=68766 RepID=UPI00262F23C9|nr:Na+/H+ antiporter NhaC family protein [Fusobacterium sp.]